jgi:hypothetical protein
MDFEEAKNGLDDLNIEYHQHYEYRGDQGKDRHKVLLPLFRGLTLPLTPEQWCSLCMGDGDDYIGGCCSSLASVQNIMGGVFRRGGYLDCEQLATIAETLESHDGDDSNFVKYTHTIPDKALLNFNNLSAWDKLAIIWVFMKDYWVPGKFYENNTTDDPLDIAVWR